MALRSILYISSRTLTILLSTILVGILTFFALTRTQVGRDGLRHQLTQQFSARFDGTLEIDELHGNLVNDLFATGVRLYDPSGHLVLSVDSVVVRPKWRELLRRGISLGRLTLYRPHLHLVRDETDAWGLSNAFRGAQRGERAGEPWSFTGLSISVEDGSFQTENRGTTLPLVEQQAIFDYANTGVDGIFARANVELGNGSKVIEILSASTRTSTLGLGLRTLRGQFVLEGDGLELNQVEMHLEESRFAASAAVSGLRALGAGELANVIVRAELAGATAAATEIRRLLPWYHLEDVVQATLRAHGPVSELVVEDLGLARGQSTIRLGGTIFGLPEQADFDLAVVQSTIDVRDVIAVAPFVDLSSYAHLDPVEFTAHGEGVVLRGEDGVWAPQTLLANVSAKSTAGAGAVQVRVGPGSTHRYGFEVDVETERLNLAPLAHDPTLASALTGRLSASGEADALDRSTGTFSLWLGPSSFAGRSVDSLRANFGLDDLRVRGTVLGRHNRSLTQIRFDALLSAEPEYTVAARVRHLDIGSLLALDSMRTDVTGEVNVVGRGRSLDSFRGSIDLDLASSTVSVGSDHRPLGPLASRIEVSDDASGSIRLNVRGDALDAELVSTTAASDVLHTAGLWGGSLRSFVRQEYLKPYPRLASSSAPHAQSEAATNIGTDTLNEVDQRHSTNSSPLPLRVAGHVQIRDATALSFLLPGLSSLHTDLGATFTYQADSASTSLKAALHADSIGTNGTLVYGLEAEIELRGRAEPGSHEPWTLVLDGDVHRARFGDQRIRDARFSAQFDGTGGSFDFASGDTLTSELNLAAELRTMTDRTRLTVSEFKYGTREYAWVNARRDALDLYGDAIVFHDLTFVNESRSSGPVQRIHVDGPLSSARGDTLVVVAETIALHQLADAVLGGAPIGGIVSGRIALTGGLMQPELTGNVDVSQLFLYNRLLGDLELRSRYVPGMPDVELDARLAPSASEPPTFAPGRHGPVVVEPNILALRGLVRLPQFDENRNVVKPSSIDLSLEAERADAFFFEYLFGEISDVEGFLTGSGRIEGTFGEPIFDGSFRLREARFNVPDYNLTLAAEAEATIDRRGIRITEGRVEDKTGGTGTVRGAILFNDYRFFSFDLSAQLTDVQIMDVMNARDFAFYGQIWASGNVTLTGPLYAAMLQSSDIETHPKSEIFIPLNESAESSDPGFIVFADSSGSVPDFRALSRRSNILGSRPAGERAFVDGLGMDLNIFAPPGSTVHLVIDPLLGDVMNAVSSGRIHLLRTEGEYFTYGALSVSSGDYLFTAGDVFMRRFLIDEGTIRWDGDPTNAELNVVASYRTRASTAGLPGISADTESSPLIPIIVRLHIVGRVAAPAVDLRLALERRDRDVVGQRLEAILNDPERTTQYATSVLLTNTFLLTTDQFADSDQGLSGTRNQFAFNSLSQLVANQINRYLSHALPNVDVNFGLQGERAQDLDVTYGVALRLLDERLIIRGEGVYQNDQQNAARGEFVVQVRLSPTVSVEMFYRREGDVLSDQTLTNTTGAGVSYQTRFSSWQRLMQRLFGRSGEHEGEEPPELTDVAADAGG